MLCSTLSLSGISVTSLLLSHLLRSGFSPWGEKFSQDLGSIITQGPDLSPVSDSALLCPAANWITCAVTLLLPQPDRFYFLWLRQEEKFRTLYLPVILTQMQSRKCQPYSLLAWHPPSTLIGKIADIGLHWNRLHLFLLQERYDILE